jgi:hypothetical protein
LIALTFVLFAIALLEKGVFLVSHKLIVMAHKNDALAETLDEAWIASKSPSAVSKISRAQSNEPFPTALVWRASFSR